MRVWLVILALGLFGVSLPANAQTDDDRARTHFEAGRSYYDQARYDDASREFQQAFDLSGRPEMLLNLSQAQERALRYDDAIASARRYLELRPKADDRKTVEDRIQSLQELKLRYEQGGPAPLAPPGATSSTPLPDDPTAPSSVQPGAETAPPAAAPPTAASPGDELPAPSAAIERPSTDAPNRFTIPAIVLMGTGGAALVASLVTGLIAHADYKSLQRRCTPDGACPLAAEDELDEGKTLSVASTVLTILGVVAAGTGTALLVIGANERDEAQTSPTAEASARLRLAPGPTPLSAAARLSF